MLSEQIRSQSDAEPIEATRHKMRQYATSHREWNGPVTFLAYYLQSFSQLAAN
ncbi:MAG: hypothetical protein AAF654_08345 [Myxococcota bacterium]